MLSSVEVVLYILCLLSILSADCIVPSGAGVVSCGSGVVCSGVDVVAVCMYWCIDVVYVVYVLDVLDVLDALYLLYASYACMCMCICITGGDCESGEEERKFRHVHPSIMIEETDEVRVSSELSECIIKLQDRNV